MAALWISEQSVLAIKYTYFIDRFAFHADHRQAIKIIRLAVIATTSLISSNFGTWAEL